MGGSNRGTCGDPGLSFAIARIRIGFKTAMAGGSSIARVLQVTIYVTDLAEKSDFNRVWEAHFNEINLPARAMIGVADLGTGVKLELVATAAVDG